MQRIFVETTIQIHRLLRNPASYDTIQTTLQTHEAVTSTYVWMEVQRTLAIQKLQTDTAALTTLGTKTSAALADVATDANMAKGEHNCWALGDLIITLECPSDAMLWTTNFRHFEPLCKALNKHLFYPDQALH